MPIIVCEECGVEVQAKRKDRKFCDDCRTKRARQQGTERERSRRLENAEQIRRRDRERYATDPRVAEQKREAARLQYWKVRADEERYQKLKTRTTAASRRWIDRHYYGGNRQKVFERDGHQCTICGSNEHLHIHHIDGNGYCAPPEERNNSLENLTLLCAGCHARIHREIESETKEKK